jgi:repressor LexA
MSNDESETIDLETLFNTRYGTFVLRVKGDSMIEEHITDGDYVIVERRTYARDGEIVVAKLADGTLTMKRYFREGGNVRLQPSNASMLPLILDSATVQITGVLLGVLRVFKTSTPAKRMEGGVN